MAFKKATRLQRKLRLCLYGVSGGGKTLTSLRLAKDLCGSGRIAVIDTERSSASIYSDKYDFDAAPLERYGVDDYCAMIREAAEAGYDVLIIDSLSHAWEARGGLLEQVQEIKRAKRYNDDMRAWGDIKPIEDRLWSAILDAPMHVIVTMRGKTQYEVSKDDKGKMHIEKLGLGPIQRANKEYEFDIVGRMDQDNTLVIEKTRCSPLKGKCFAEPGPEVAAILKTWLGTGEAMQAPERAPESEPTTEAHAEAKPTPANPEPESEASLRMSLYRECVAAAKASGMPDNTVPERLKSMGHGNLKGVPIVDLREILAFLSGIAPESGPTEEPKPATAPEAAQEKPKRAGVKVDPEILKLLDSMGLAPIATGILKQVADHPEARADIVTDLRWKSTIFAEMLEAQRAFMGADAITSAVVDGVTERLGQVAKKDGKRHYIELAGKQ